jgi:hypothetical protein
MSSFNPPIFSNTSFNKVLLRLQNRFRTAIQSALRLLSRANRNSPTQKVYSRLYGYQRNPQGKIVQIESEIKTISLIFYLLGLGLSPTKVKLQLDALGIRNRSGKPFSNTEIKNMVRPIYTGRIKNVLGVYVRSKVYSPIVSRKTLKRALENLKTENLGSF